MNSRIMQVKMCGSCIWLYNDGSVNGKDSRMSGGCNFVSHGEIEAIFLKMCIME